MDSVSLATSLLGLQAQKTQGSLQAVLMRQQVQADQGITDLLSQAAQAAPAPGTGQLVDKTA
jgi:hypothetical protein